MSSDAMISMQRNHRPEGNAVNMRVSAYACLASTVTTHPWLGSDMAFATKRQRLKDHPG